MVSIRVYETPQELAAAAALALVDALARAQAAGLVPAVCLTGGTVADLVHREVARVGADSAVDWTAVDFWWGDERYVETTSPDRNALHAHTAFLDVLGVPAGRIHAMPSTGSACSVEEGARAYAAELARRQEPFLVTMLGMGPDGHVASLFPGAPGLGADEATAIAVTGSPKPPPQRISLTVPALNNSESVWLLVTGPDKAAAVADATTSADLPARRVRGLAETVWFLDRAAASGL
ncbi:6-phosphogluconolactonase [Nocardioides baekrokdamisoli]|uniref:6-phosphogluconolactonase n=1 Tax=Nocardioides baekrokdamisoli TaxID=1804624 RepID=A0A3G9IBZ7_9ACTN|nr:6-phosphogluconolactonase [Nocardioides baekrokdamisoli]BBH15872.1 6-phosphogluconolactonase [Nocardioides baekrokdamisoli]